MAVKLEVSDSQGNVTGSLEINLGDHLSFGVESAVRVGHLSVAASTLASALGASLGFIIKSEAPSGEVKPQPAPEPQEQEPDPEDNSEED